MKQAKKPTRSQKEVIYSHGLIASQWAVIEETDFYLKLINKENGQKKSIDRFVRKGNRR